MKTISKASKITKACRPVLALAFLLGWSSVGCEYYSERPQEKTSNQESTKTQESERTIVSGDSETIKNLEAKISELEGQLANKDDTEAKALQAQIAELQRTVAGLKDDSRTVQPAATPSAPPAAPTPPTPPTPEKGKAPTEPTDKGNEEPAGKEKPETPWVPGTPGIPVPGGTDECTPMMYTDGRMAVPFVITGYRHVNWEGSKARFVMDTSYVALNDRISSIKIQKGPNYVEGDGVEFFEDANFEGRSITLRPGVYPDLSLLKLTKLLGEDILDENVLGANDEISSLKIVRSSDAASKKCADVKRDHRTWTGKIHLIAAIYQDANYGGMFEQVLSNVSDLTSWGKDDGSFDDTISSLKLFKGPDYSPGDLMKLFEDAGLGGTAIEVRPDQSYYDDPTPGSIAYIGNDPLDFNDNSELPVLVW